MTDPAKIRLEKTCERHPEQYDAFYGARRVGYVRLRSGLLRVDCPWVGGVTVYEAENVPGDGCFENEERRQYHLTVARAAIARWMDDLKAAARK